MLANAGHFDVEIDLAALHAAAAGAAARGAPARHASTTSATGALNLLASGRVVNLAAGQGHPAAVMDMSFANQALAVEHLVAPRRGARPGRASGARRASTARSRGSSSPRSASRSTSLTDEQARLPARLGR